MSDGARSPAQTGSGRERTGTAATGAVPVPVTPSPGRRTSVGDLIFRCLTTGFAALVPLLLCSLLFVLLYESSEAVRQFSWRFFTTSTWDPVAEHFGVLPFVYGTLVTAFLALLQAVPLGIGTALFLSEMAPGFVRTPVSFLVELLATIPSVIYGLWGVFVLVPWSRNYIEPALSSTLGFLPFFQGPAYGVGMLTASMILAVMIVPY